MRKIKNMMLANKKTKTLRHNKKKVAIPAQCEHFMHQCAGAIHCINVRPTSL